MFIMYSGTHTGHLIIFN